MSDVTTFSPEQLDALGDEIATFAARIDVAEHALITRLRVFDAHEAWGSLGFHSCAHWLSWRIGISLKAAREKVRVARALGSLPKLDAVFARGEISYSKARAITRVATSESEQDFIEVAAHASAAQLERMTRAFQRVRDDAKGAMMVRRNPRRFVRRSETPGGMVRIEMQLPPEEAAVVWEAMQSALDQASAEAVTEAPAEARPAPANDPEEVQERRADAVVDVARAYLQHQPRTLGSAYELVVITTAHQLEQGPDGVGGYLRDGTPVPLQIARMLACDGARVDVTMGESGELLDVGRRTRAIPSAIGRALWLRDGGCRVPGCGRNRHLHGHHIQGWAEGGPTSLSNLVLVCSSHHRLIHEGKLSAEVRDDKIVFLDRRGQAIPGVAPSAASGHELEELEQFLREADLHVDASTMKNKWDGTHVSVEEILDWMLIAEQTRTAQT
jgi:hypothetical protein